MRMQLQSGDILTCMGKGKEQMKDTAKVTSKGQVTIPARVRRALKLASGDRLVFEKSGRDQCVMRRSGASDGKMYGFLRKYANKRRSSTVEEMNDAISDLLKEKHHKL